MIANSKIIDYHYCFLFLNHTYSHRIFKYIAISPSLWANYQNIFVFEEQYYAKSKTIDAEIYFCCGNYEVLNLVWNNVDLLEHRLKSRQYKSLTFKKKIYAGYSHNGVVKPAVQDGLKRVVN